MSPVTAGEQAIFSDANKWLERMSERAEDVNSRGHLCSHLVKVYLSVFMAFVNGYHAFRHFDW